MSRGVKTMTEEVIARYQREGRGRGVEASYCPWIYITDFYSTGRTHEPFSEKFGRTHQLLSDGEWETFVMLEWAQDVQDAREQFPLPRDITLGMAQELGVKHQCYPGTHVPLVMTVDFMVTRIRNGEPRLHAFNVKAANDLEDPMKLSYLEVARSACEGMSIDHHLVISDRLPKQKLKNLQWIRRALLEKDAVEPHEGFYNEQMFRMTRDIASRRFNGSLVEYCQDYDDRCSLAQGEGLRVARMLLWHRTLQMDLNNLHPEHAHMDSFRLSALPGRLRSVGGTS